MNIQSDPTQFKESQRRAGILYLMGWQKRWRTFENGAQSVSSRLVELAHVKSGDKVLDIATGTEYQKSIFFEPMYRLREDFIFSLCKPDIRKMIL
jgi:hypothetical protein